MTQKNENENIKNKHSTSLRISLYTLFQTFYS